MPGQTSGECRSPSVRRGHAPCPRPHPEREVPAGTDGDTGSGGAIERVTSRFAMKTRNLKPETRKKRAGTLLVSGFSLRLTTKTRTSTRNQKEAWGDSFWFQVSGFWSSP